METVPHPLGGCYMTPFGTRITILFTQSSSLSIGIAKSAYCEVWNLCHEVIMLTHSVTTSLVACDLACFGSLKKIEDYILENSSFSWIMRTHGV